MSEVAFLANLRIAAPAAEVFLHDLLNRIVKHGHGLIHRFLVVREGDPGIGVLVRGVV